VNQNPKHPVTGETLNLMSQVFRRNSPAYIVKDVDKAVYEVAHFYKIPVDAAYRMLAHSDHERYVITQDVKYWAE
jgi:hypothetical protein